MAESSVNALPTDDQVDERIKRLGYQVGANIDSTIDMESYRVSMASNPNLVLCLLKYTKEIDEPSLQFRETMFNEIVETWPKFTNCKYLGTVHLVLESLDNFYVICDYVRSPKRDLDYELIQVEKEFIPKSVLKKWFHCVVLALNHLHSHGYCHRDLWVDKILIKSRNSAMVIGYCLRKESDQTNPVVNPRTETDDLRAFREPNHGPIDFFKEDVWALGCIMFTTMTDADEIPETFAELQQLLDSKVEGVLYDLLFDMLVTDQATRLSMAHVLQHPYWTEDETVSTLPDGGQLIAKEQSVVFRPFPDSTRALLKSQGIKIMDFLSRGGFGSVHKVKLSGQLLQDHPNDEIAAMKVAKVKKDTARRKVRLGREKRLTKNVHHENIIKYITMVEDNHNWMFTVMELAIGSLSGMSRANGITTKDNAKAIEDRMRPLLRGAIQGVKYLHTNGWCHRDIKPENILIKSNGQAVICDWSISREAEADALVKTYVGTPGFMAPQLVYKIPYNPFKNDIWAIGVTMYTVLTGLELFHFPKQNFRKLKKEVTEPIFDTRTDLVLNSVMSDIGQEAVYNMLCEEEKQRPPIEAVLDHGFFKDGTSGTSGPSAEPPSAEPAPSTSGIGSRLRDKRKHVTEST